LRRAPAERHDAAMTAKCPPRALIVPALLSAALILPLAGKADDGREEVRRTVACSGSSSAELKLRSDDEAIRVELEIDSARGGSRWAVILVHERRIAYRGGVRTTGGGSAKLRRSVRDWYGPDTVAARATGPRAETCRVSATLP